MSKHKFQESLSFGPGHIKNIVDHKLYHKTVYKVDPHFRKLFNEVERMIQEGRSKEEILT